MGTILQERAPQQRPERPCVWERGWRKKAASRGGCGGGGGGGVGGVGGVVGGGCCRPDASRDRMGRRQSQRRSPQPPRASPGQENNHERKLQQRRRNKPNTPSFSQNSSQRTSESNTPPVEVQQAAQSSRLPKHAGVRAGRPPAASRRRRRSDSSPDPQPGRSANLEAGRPSVGGEGDSDTDLSDSERLSALPSGGVPPKLELRPEVLQAEGGSASRLRLRDRGHGEFDFPDFLPPPFNSWSLSQLAVFYNMEGRAAPRPRPVGPLERYLERLLQLEWHQIQTVQEDSGKSDTPDVISSCHRSPAAASSRLSSPKCILQCQRAFPLTFLSSLASHSALLSSCACTPCRIRYSAGGATCCRSTQGHACQSRLGSLLERRCPAALPKRSCSESRVHSSERGLASRALRFGSPARTSSHLRRMQALGNIRNPVQGANAKPRCDGGDSSVRTGRERVAARVDHRTGCARRRSGSEHGKTGAERHQQAPERHRNGSECRRGAVARRAASELREREIKPDAVAAIMDNLPASKHPPMNRPNRAKQVEFVT